MYIKKKETLDSDAAVAEVRKVYFEHFKKGKMTVKMFNQHSSINFNHIRKYLKTWKITLQLSGIYSPQDVTIAELRRVYFEYYENNRMTLENFRLHSKISYYMISRYFGGWENALKQAGIGVIPKYTLHDEKAIIAEIKRVYFEFFENSFMTLGKFLLHAKVNYNKIVRHYGSWEKAINQAELNMILKYTTYQKESIVVELRKVYFQHFENTRMTFKNFSSHSKIKFGIIQRYLGGWGNALNIAGINYSYKPLNPDQKRKQIIADLHRIKASNQDQYFNYTMYKQKKGRYPRKEITELFKSQNWEALLIEKFKLHNKKVVYTQEQLFSEVKKVWEKFGRRPSYIEFRENATIKMRVFEKEFSTWTLCIEKFCIENKSYNSAEHGRSFHTSEKLLLQELESINKIKSIKNFTFKDYKLMGGKYSRDTFNTYFGNWQKAKEFVVFKNKIL
ncbi:homing endonuclease associated repeat-containing protein [Flavobacterium sp.]|uniref:homing endonuclease associated repeat-containing protein n=1 Tax=Flavobacterium sp. TaxID=239 RepID=UPI00286C5AF2|nr:hypothetical protein [Flavobacterium sp.]